MNLFDVQDKLLVTGGTGMVGVAYKKFCLTQLMWVVNMT